MANIAQITQEKCDFLHFSALKSVKPLCILRPRFPLELCEKSRLTAFQIKD